MNYNILDAKIEFQNNEIHKITVLVEVSENDTRSMTAGRKLTAGYFQIPPSAEVSNQLLQEVAGYGKEIENRRA